MSDLPMIQRLDWDSRFFGLSVGRLELNLGDIVSSGMIEDVVRRSDYDLIYVFLPVSEGRMAELEKPRSALVALGGRCVDLKTFYRKKVADFAYAERAAVFAKASSDRLLKLAYASGWCSRFSQDERLRPFQEQLYGLWLEKELTEGRVFVYPSEENPLGLVTVTMQNGVGRIGLVAVDANSCGKGIGTKLLEDVEAWLRAAGARECSVVTQGMNIAACRLYEKSGFAQERQIEVWHVWRCR